MLLSLFALLSVGAAAQSAGAPYGSVKCLRTELDGTLVLRVQSKGRNRPDSRQQVCKNAVYEVIFRGVKVDGSQTLSCPLIYEVNAEEKYQDFFNVFFADGGKYTEFTSFASKKDGSSKRRGEHTQIEREMTVTVNRPALLEYLKEQNIIQNRVR